MIRAWASPRGVAISAASEAFVSIVTAWEIAIKRAIAKLDVLPLLADLLDSHGFTLVPVTLEHAARSSELPLHHRDPFDRMLIAQAHTKGSRWSRMIADFSPIRFQSSGPERHQPHLVVSFFNYEGYQFLIPDFTFQNCQDVFSSSVTWRTYWMTLKFCAIVC